VETLTDVVGVDEEPQVHALDRTYPGGPVKKGRCSPLTHDDKPHGTTGPFAACTMSSSCYPHHRHEEWLKFLHVIDRDTSPGQALHVILDNDGTPHHPTVTKWLARPPRFHLHGTPTSASWLNLVARRFGEPTRMRRGVCNRVPELGAAIDKFIRLNNKSPKPFVWTRPVDDRLKKIQHGNTVIETPL
jgi:hypothetical protein